MKSWFSVHIETEGPDPRDEWIDALIEALEKMPGVKGPVVSWGKGPGGTLSVRASNPGDAGQTALRAFGKALAEVGIQTTAVRVDAMTEDYRDAWLEEPPSGLMGVTEIAKALGVSKQRVSELRHRADFPKPVADLAASPVWTELSLGHFVRNWERRPGRPRKVV